jgi:uncharacterized membrane protein YccC
MALTFSSVSSTLNRQSLEHAVRTAVAATISVLIARAFRLPEVYWASVSTLVVMQSTLGAALTVSGQRFAGTALGSVLGAMLSWYFESSALVFGLAVFALGVVCAVLRLDRSAYRFAGITLAIIMLVTRDKPAWIIAAHRFSEVSVGIAVGLALTALWPQ